MNSNNLTFNNYINRFRMKDKFYAYHDLRRYNDNLNRNLNRTENCHLNLNFLNNKRKKCI